MSTPIAKLFQACDPMKPATSEQYVDCSDVRGGHAFTREFCGALTNAGDDGSFLRFLITGHVGGGKSSELLHLKAQLEQMEKPYLVVMMDSKEYIDDNDVTPNDILLAIVSELAETVKAKAGINLDDSYFVKKLNEASDLLKSTVEVSEGDVTAGLLKLKVKLLRIDESARRKVRGALVQNESSFIQQINLVFEEARTAIRKKNYRDIVLILDNLEKIQRIDGVDEGTESHRELFIARAQKFVGLNCNFVLTVPLTLVNTHGGQLRGAYGQPPHTLPMIKVSDRSGKRYDGGYVKLRELLSKRGANPEVIDNDARDLLIEYSGGHVRDLLGTLRGAISTASGSKVVLADAKAALGQIVRSLTVSRAAWERLVALEESPDRTLDLNDPVCISILEQLYALEYVNGEDNQGFLQDQEAWYAIAPVLKELRSYTTALSAYKADLLKQ
ncbi:MAG: hypothetical protein K8R88_04495 [Armatimonadetes bacterium]|nr:hypothetical protein [Armatimonadota bacterium]